MNADEEHREERRATPLSPEQIDAIKEQILASVYEDIGRSLVKKIVWLVGTLLIALLTWLAAKGYIKP